MPCRVITCASGPTESTPTLSPRTGPAAREWSTPSTSTLDEPSAYRNRWITTDAVAQQLAVEPTPGPRTVGSDVVASNLIAFGTSILAFGDGALAYELSARLETIRRVDLAGRTTEPRRRTPRSILTPANSTSSPPCSRSGRNCMWPSHEVL